MFLADAVAGYLEYLTADEGGLGQCHIERRDRALCVVGPGWTGDRFLVTERDGRGSCAGGGGRASGRVLVTIWQLRRVMREKGAKLR